MSKTLKPLRLALVQLRESDKLLTGLDQLKNYIMQSNHFSQTCKLIWNNKELNHKKNSLSIRRRVLLGKVKKIKLDRVSRRNWERADLLALVCDV